MASGTTFGNLRVTVQADTSKFSKGIRKAQKDLTLFQKTTRALSGNMAKLMGGLGIGLTGGALAKGFMDTAAAIDETAKAARNLGVETEAFIGLRHAADLSGLSVSALESGLKRFTRNLNDADRGLESSAENFQALGLSASELMKLSLDDQVALVADALSNVTNETQRAAIRMELFGRAGSEMGVLMEQGGDGIRKMVNEAGDLGMLFSAEEAKKLETFNDEMTRLKQIIGGVWRGIVIDVAPVAVNVVKALQETFEGLKLYAEAQRRESGEGWTTQFDEFAKRELPWMRGIWMFFNRIGQQRADAAFADIAQGLPGMSAAERRASEERYGPGGTEMIKEQQRTNAILERQENRQAPAVAPVPATATIMK